MRATLLRAGFVGFRFRITIIRTVLSLYRGDAHLAFDGDMDTAWTSGTLFSCGNHRANSCGGCPQGHGSSWCHGECHWVDNACVLAPGNNASATSRMTKHALRLQ